MAGVANAYVKNTFPKRCPEMVRVWGSNLQNGLVRGVGFEPTR
jgi:hypothetical protein